MNLTALIVTFNRLEKLKKTIQATLALPFKFIVIVNNASSDGTAAWLKTIEDIRVIVINLPINSGGAGGFKIGAQHICDNIETDWITFYDDDARPESKLINSFDKINPDMDSVYCGRVLDETGNDCKMNIPWKKRPVSFRQNYYYFRNPQDFIISPDEKCLAITFSFVGCIISRKVLEQNWKEIKDKLFIYYDDVIFSWYLTKKNIKIKYEPSLIYYHDINQINTGLMPEWKVYYLIRNLILSRKIYGADSFYSHPAIIFRLAKYLISGLNQFDKRKYYSYVMNGIVDGLRNISGKRH